MPPSALTCPECGGALWEVENGRLLRFRCHLGHGYTGDGLSEHQFRNIEAALWTAMRVLEESAALRRRLADRTRNSNLESLTTRYERQACEAEERAALIRSVLVTDDVEIPAKPLRPSPKARERAGNVDTSVKPQGAVAASKRPRARTGSGKRAKSKRVRSG
jgi:hypothetical protein